MWTQDPDPDYNICGFTSLIDLKGKVFFLLKTSPFREILNIRNSFCMVKDSIEKHEIPRIKEYCPAKIATRFAFNSRLACVFVCG